MTEDSHPDLRFPIGRFEPPAEISAQLVASWIAEIESLPERLRTLVGGLDDEQLDTPYRPGGWSVRQVVHHLVDSHLNSYVRFKWALTEERPVIKAYWEDRWAELADYRDTPLEVSLDLLESLHARWCVLLRALGPADLEREFVHPDSGPMTLGANIGAYAWHGRHHLAHIERLGDREGWELSGGMRRS